MAQRFLALRRFGFLLAVPLIAMGRAILLYLRAAHSFPEENVSPAAGQAQQGASGFYRTLRAIGRTVVFCRRKLSPHSQQDSAIQPDRATTGQTKRHQLRSYTSLVLMLLGSVLLLYVGSQYGEMYLEQRKLAAEWQQQQPLQSHKPTTDHTEKTSTARYALKADAHSGASENTGLTRLTIPSIGFDSIVVEGTNYHDLLLGPGHIEETAEPGQIGNAVISGHRDTFFRHIHELRKGDLITVQRNGKTYEYEVTGKKIVKPNAMWVIRPTPDHELTLLTCYPTYYIGPAPDRLVVFSRLRQQTTPALAQTADSPEIANTN